MLSFIPLLIPCLLLLAGVAMGQPGKTFRGEQGFPEWNLEI